MTPSLLQKARTRRIAVLERLHSQDMTDVDKLFLLDTARQQQQIIRILPFISRRSASNRLNFSGKSIAA